MWYSLYCKDEHSVYSHTHFGDWEEYCLIYRLYLSEQSEHSLTAWGALVENGKVLKVIKLA